MTVFVDDEPLMQSAVDKALKRATRPRSAFVTCRACGGSGVCPLVGRDGYQDECPHCWGAGNVLRDSSDGCPR